MNQNKYVFAQLVAFLDRNHFNYLARKYSGDRYVKHFTCWNQLLALMFGQLGSRESLRDLITVMEAHESKCYHLGLGRKPVPKTTFATANQNRDYRIFEEFAFYMMDLARSKRATDIFKLKGKVFAFDSTTIPLAYQSSGGQSSGDTKEESRLTSYLIQNHKCLPTFMSLQLLSTILR